MQHHVPLPLSNSDAAKDMRLAVLLAILAREIDRHIFHPTYILSEDSHIRETLVNLAMKDSKKEFFCRQILLSIDPNKEQEILGERIRTVTRNVMRLLSGLPEAFYSEMRDAIEGLATQAGELWSRFRRAERKYEVDFDPLKWGDDEWRPFVFPDQAGAVGESPVARTLSESLLTVFPRICTVEDGIRDAYTFVIELNRSMPQCVAAGKELIREPSSPTSNGRGASNRQRRISIASSSMNGQNGVSLGKKGKQEGSKQG
ncbi:hypothetical protein ASPZODRAFT_133909 [Penicilliopsis zonata CBS 506.65]|uniref:Uncharacterized protein n=1 Tax=Penicilliopsis zonata CBS 506.65 TaxID=1073090 RepID=A0A1L9SDI5_9EURO|nr:hypothetical protein ASPZODRAFT_133909 [Penicilliopsis zonata CBS 506.65]OJJ45266.1 hypothetical protein ASPZODRAFT_133909 [Penicilliopsis zonata CBS 506.65]